jgi:4-hydroxy-tetrahydrodipicolinate synthase
MKENFEIDYDELQRFANWLVSFKGVNGLVTNGHTGEIFSLSPKERAEVTKAVVETDKPICKSLKFIIINLKVFFHWTLH